MHEIVRLVHSDLEGAMKLRSDGQKIMSGSVGDIGRDQWLSRLVAAGRKLELEEVRLATHLVETLISVRQRLRRDD